MITRLRPWNTVQRSEQNTLPVLINLLKHKLRRTTP